MFRFNKPIAIFPLIATILSALIAIGYNLNSAYSSEAQKPNLYGLPIVINFPNLPAVPEKIKAAKPSPQAGAALKNIPSYSRPSTSDGPDAAKSR